METQKKYRYFLRYANQVGGGSTGIERDTPITCMDDLDFYAENLYKQNPKNGMCMITFWKRFEEAVG